VRRIAEQTAGQLEPDTPVIVIDNVADYYHRGTDKRQWDLERDFPCAAPPWPQALFEWRRRTSSGTRAAAACHWRTGLAADADMQAFVSRTIGDDLLEWPDAHWLIFASFYVADATHAVQALPLRAWLPVARDGSPGAMALEYATRAADALGEEQVREEVTRLMAVPMLAVTFAHCRNVTERAAPVPAKLRRARERAGRPILDYRVLDIEPMWGALKDAACTPDGRVRHKQALHICRGHFKDYRESGLFGKHRGLFWWEQNMRGSADSGRVVKDYEVVGCAA